MSVCLDIWIRNPSKLINVKTEKPFLLLPFDDPDYDW